MLPDVFCLTVSDMTSTAWTTLTLVHLSDRAGAACVPVVVERLLGLYTITYKHSNYLNPAGGGGGAHGTAHRECVPL